MKSKAEIVEALKYHMSGDCSECYYRDGRHTCNFTPERGLFADILALLNKSDFEVTNEILSRSNGLSFYVPYLPDELGIKTLGLAFQDGPVFRIAFDAEGNIL